MQKISKTDSVSIPVAGDSNVLEGTGLENVPIDDDYRVSILATASATGLKHTVKADLQTAVEESVVSTQNRVPIHPDDFVDEFDVAGGSKLRLILENTTAGALTYFYTVTLTPLSML